MEVLWVSVKREFADFNEGAVALRPDLGDVIDVEFVLLTLCKCHDLDVHSPRWEVALLDVGEEVSGCEILVLHAHFSGFLGSEILDALVSLVVIFHKEWFPLVVDPFVSMRAVSIHVTESIGSSSVGEEDHYLVEGLR